MMKNYQVKLTNKATAKSLIIANHYSHKWSSCRYAFGLFLEGELLGAAIYGYPVGRQVVTSISPLLDKDEVLELTRLWINDSEPRNTESWFIGQTFKWLKRNTKIRVLISYSDPMFGHVGTIYQATNWLYQGNNTMLVKGYLHYIKGEWLHPHTCVAKFGTVKQKVLKKIDPLYKRKDLKKKHRYLYFLGSKTDKQKLSQTLKHPILAYPKDNKNSNWE